LQPLDPRAPVPPWRPVAFYGARRFEEFLANVGCARTLLSERLATLVEHGVLQREPYREPGQRERHQYLLTDKGPASLICPTANGDRSAEQVAPTAPTGHGADSADAAIRSTRSSRCRHLASAAVVYSTSIF
jgi:hypothetical protein